MLTIETPRRYRFALDHLGFRPFFLLGSLFAVVAIVLWFAIYSLSAQPLPSPQLAPQVWHGHEMLYGYAMAVIAGFLLTAVRNWTSVQTLHGKPLLLLAALWLGARLLPFVDHPQALAAMALLDLTFNLWLAWALLHPIVRTRQWPQLGIWFKVLLLGVSNGLFYLGLLGLLQQGVMWGLYSGLYLVISLILLMGRRVIPFFIEKGVDEQVTLTNYRWLDLASLVLMLLFWLSAAFFHWGVASMVLAFTLATLHLLRMVGWHTPGIWKKPLLWVLYIGYGWVVAGFLLHGLSQLGLINPFLALHAFAVGGIGTITLGMMARVAYGHTGRDVFNPPPLLFEGFLILALGALVRVVLPWLLPQFYLLWIEAAQLLWIAAFALFFWLYAPLLIKPRLDGRYG